MNDLINRQKMIDKMRQRRTLFCKNKIEFMALSKDEKARVDEIDNCIADLVNASSVESKKGKWIDTSWKVYKCSECGNYLDFSGLNAGRGDANYCPNCGAEMKEKNELL